MVNWLYQVLGIALSVLQELLGDQAAFTSGGQFVDRVNGSKACGGMVSTIWGTELGSRREQALIAWDYDVDLVAFITPSFDFGSLWRQAAETWNLWGSACFVTNAISNTVSVHIRHWRIAIGGSGAKLRVWQTLGLVEQVYLRLHQNRGSAASQ